MALNNPALANSPALNGTAQRTDRTLTAEELNALYAQPAATTTRPGVDPTIAPTPGTAQPVGGSADPMTYEDTLAKTAGLFALVLLGALIGWVLPGLGFVAAIVGFGLGMWASFKKTPSVPLYVSYALVEGVFVGGISHIFEYNWPGIAVQAVLATASVFAVVLLLFRSGKVRTSPKLNKIFMVAAISYLVFSLLNLALTMFNVPGFTTMFGARDIEIFGIPLGVGIGVLAILMASYALIMDFEYVKNGVEARAPRVYGWTAAFGLIVTIVWLYIEFIRLLAILRGND